MRNNMLLAITVTGVLLVLPSALLLIERFGPKPGASLEDLRVSLPRDPNDTLVLELSELFRDLTPIPQNGNILSPDGWAARNREVGERFDLWRATRDTGFGTPAWEGHNRFIADFDLKRDRQGDHRIETLRRAVHFLIAEAVIHFRAGRDEQGMERLDDASRITALFAQNPTLTQYMNQIAIWSWMTQLFLEEIPPSLLPRVIDRIPDSDSMRRALVAAMYAQAVYLERRIANDSPVLGSLDQEQWYDKERTHQLNYRLFSELIENTEGLWNQELNMDPELGLFEEWTNRIGVHYVSSNIRQDWVWAKARMLVITLDSLRVQAHLRAQGLPSDRESAIRIIEQLDLRSPVDGDLYRVDTEGRLFAEMDVDWRPFDDNETLLPLIAEFAIFHGAAKAARENQTRSHSSHR